MQRWLWAGLVLMFGCTPDPAPAPDAAPSGDGEAPVEVGGRSYVKPEGVILDVPRLIGQELTVVQGTELGEQLGLKKEEERLPGVRGLELRHQNATLRVARGIVYYVSHTYDVPVSRVLALQLVGLPGNLSPLKPQSLQFRIDRPTHGIRRIALQRAEADSELVTQIEVWSALPTEAF